MTDGKESETKGKAGWLGGLGILGFALLKFKAYIFVGLKALSFLKMGWIFKSLITLFISIGVYWALFGPMMAVIIIPILIIHEAGHYLFMKINGLNPRPAIFVPGLGAFTAMNTMPKDQATHAWVALAGPLVGGVGAAICYWYGLTSDSLLLMVGGMLGFLLNLLQLIPAKPLDGGFVAGALSKWLLIPGTGLLFFLAWKFQSPLSLVIAIVSLLVLINQFKRGAENPMKPATLSQKVLISTVYFVLASSLSYLYALSHDEITARMPEKLKAKVMKYHRDTPDHEAFTDEEEDGSR